MKRVKGPAEPAKHSDQRPGASELDLRALLDHLGRLLAQEYTALLTETTVAETPPPGEETR